MDNQNRILIKTVFGRILFHSMESGCNIEVEKNAENWKVRISGIAERHARLMKEQAAEIHAFYFESNQKWWLSNLVDVDVKQEENEMIEICLVFESVYKYKPDEM